MPPEQQTLFDLFVVDSRPQDYDALIPAAEAESFATHVATSGEDALRLPRRTSSGLWLINTQLPDMAGVDLLSLLGRGERASTYALVGDAYSHEDEVAARREGATIYVCKPPQTNWLRVCTSRRPGVLAMHSAHGPPATRVRDPAAGSMGGTSLPGQLARRD